MKTYHGERTEKGCEVTVDGAALYVRSDLSGNANGAFDWGFIGNGQLSMAILSDFFRDDLKAKSMCDGFEKKVIANLPHRAWTLTGKELTDAVASLAATDRAPAPDGIDVTRAEYVNMPAATVRLASPNTAIGIGRNNRAQLLKEKRKSPATIAAALEPYAVSEAAGEMAHAAEQVAAAAVAVGRAAHQVAHVHDRPSDEAMSTANRAADQKADATNRVVDEAAALARSAVDEANRVVEKLNPKPD